MAVIASLISVTVGQMTSGGKDSGPHIAAFAGAETIGGALMQVFYALAIAGSIRSRLQIVQQSDLSDESGVGDRLIPDGR